MAEISVLLVDDEPANLAALETYLGAERPSWHVTTATSANDARTAIERSVFDVVVTDLVMESRASGIEVLRAAKERSPLTMVIVITAYDDELDRYRAFENGAFDCISKNTPKLVAAEEIVVKASVAAEFRGLALEHGRQSERESVLSRFFDPAVFEIIDRDPQLLHLRRALVTVVFWDIRGFSALADSLKAYPDLLSGFLTEYFELATGVIFENDGVLDKFIGDGVMALFGALSEPDDDGATDAQSAARAALSFRDGFTPLVEKWRSRWGYSIPNAVDIRLGCGIHTGTVLVGAVGTERRDQFTALGSDVNFAARLEGLAREGEILLTRPTCLRIEARFATRKWGVVDDIKNIPGTFDVFELDREKR